MNGFGKGFWASLSSRLLFFRAERSERAVLADRVVSDRLFPVQLHQITYVAFFRFRLKSTRTTRHRGAIIGFPTYVLEPDTTREW